MAYRSTWAHAFGYTGLEDSITIVTGLGDSTNTEPTADMGGPVADTIETTDPRADPTDTGGWNMALMVDLEANTTDPKANPTATDLLTNKTTRDLLPAPT